MVNFLQAFHFERDDVAMPGLAKYMRKSSDEKVEHAQTLMKYQNDRGGEISLEDIKRPTKANWGSALDALKVALDIEKKIRERQLDLHKIASKHQDYDVSIIYKY